MAFLWLKKMGIVSTWGFFILSNNMHTRTSEASLQYLSSIPKLNSAGVTIWLHLHLDWLSVRGCLQERLWGSLTAVVSPQQEQNSWPLSRTHQFTGVRQPHKCWHLGDECCESNWLCGAVRCHTADFTCFHGVLYTYTVHIL